MPKSLYFLCQFSFMDLLSTVIFLFLKKYKCQQLLIQFVLCFFNLNSYYLL